MRIAIRTDSSYQIGTGHMARCLALAEELRRMTAQVEFICQDLPGNVASLAVTKGFNVHFLKTGASEECRDLLKSVSFPFDALVMDHYQLDAEYEKALKSFVGKILIIDDLANRPHIGDILVDFNFGESNKKRYLSPDSPLVPKDCKLLMGPAYALLRSEFYEARKQAQSMRSLSTSMIERVFIFFGGVDLTDETSKTLDALEQIQQVEKLRVQVVLGEKNPRNSAIQKRLEGRPNYQCSVQVENMAERMLPMDLAIGAGGTASWERLCLGLPSLVISVADNQTQACIDLDKAGYLFYLGRSQEVTRDVLVSAIMNRIQNPKETAERGRKGMQLVDGEGCRKVAATLIHS